MQSQTKGETNGGCYANFIDDTLSGHLKSLRGELVKLARATQDEDEKLEMFLNTKDHPKLSYLEDPILGGDMMLARVKGQLHFYRGSKLYQMSMKKGK